MVVLIERPPEAQNLSAAVAPSIGPVMSNQGIASHVGVFQAGIRSSEGINIPPPDTMPGQSPLNTEQDYLDAVDRMTGALRDNGVDEQTVSGIVHDMNGLRDGDSEMIASVQKAADDIQQDNLNQEDRNVWEIIVDALKNETPEQRNYLLTDAVLTTCFVAGFWLSRKYLDRLKLSPKKLQMAGTLLAAGSIACVIGGQVMVTATQTAPAPGANGHGSPTPGLADGSATPNIPGSPTPGVEATNTPEPAPNIPPGYDALLLRGNASNPNIVAEAISIEGIPNEEVVGSKYIKAHKFSEADLQRIKDSGNSQYGITAQAAEDKLNDIELLKNLTSGSVEGGRVFYFSNGLSGDAFRGFMLLVSADGNSVWLAKNKAFKDKEVLNFYPNTFSGLDLSRNYTPDLLAQFVRPWQPAETEPQETDRQITSKDITVIGGIDHLDVVFQNGTENAYLTLNNSNFKAGIEAVEMVFDASTGSWLEPIVLSQDAILPADWATNTLEGENKGKFDPEKFYLMVGGINHQNRKTVSLESNGLKIAVAVVEQYFKDNGIDPLLGLTALSQADQQALAEALSLQLDNIPELKAQLAIIRTQIAAKEGDLLSKDITRYTVIIQNGQITGVVDMGTDSPRRYVLNAEGKLVRLASELEPQLLPELTVDGPYIKRADTGEVVELKGVDIATSEMDGSNIYDYVMRNVQENNKLGINSNLVKLVMNTDDNIARIPSLAKKLDELGIYLLVTPGRIKNKGADLPDENVEKFLITLSLMLKNQNNVMYQLWNEPGDVSWNQWRPWITQLSNSIYTATQSHPIIVVSGTKWSRDFRGSNIPIDNYIVDVHDYPWSNWENSRPWWELMIGEVPVLISEIGGFIPGLGNEQQQYQSSTDTEYIKATLNLINAHPDQIHHTFWRGEASGDGIRKDGVLTPRGRVLLQERQAFPTQTVFTK